VRREKLLPVLVIASLVPALAFAQTAVKRPARAVLNTVDPDGTTALHWAVRNNDLQAVDRLIRAGATVNAANRYGITPIYLACQNGSAEAVSRLLKAGVSANATTLGGFVIGLTALPLLVGRDSSRLRAGQSTSNCYAVSSWR